MNEGVLEMSSDDIEVRRHRFPHCIVWTPIPFITWIFPFIGHMGICTSSGVIRDFAGSHFVSEDEMAFGWPTRFWQLDLSKISGGRTTWDKAVAEGSEEYGHHIHILCWDNCHSHVALVLNSLNYNGSSRWNMVNLAAAMLFRGKFVSCGGFLKQWLPFILIVTFVVVLTTVLPATTV